MTDEQILRLRARALHIARAHGRDYLAEDFAQEITALLYLKPGQTLDQAWVDFMRREYGRRGHKRNHVELDLKLPALDTKETSCDFENLLKYLDTTERLIALLYFHEGYNLDQIGYLFGVSESRICQRLKGLEERIQKALSPDEVSLGQRVPGQIPAAAQGIQITEAEGGPEVLLEAFAEMAGF